ncbi:MFS transporter [Coralliovum pocilloporae]|uniref:MFS transporter n=1 Tax=Coralliovum pocilloporae TaxID=3066369 RepID=UPI0033076914
MMLDKTKALVLLCVAQVAVVSLWFSASAVAPDLQREFAISPDRMALLTSAVQVGFVVGSLISAIAGLADRMDPRRFFMISALVGASANAAFLLVEPGSWSSITLRFMTGAIMAGTYPVGMKLAVSWSNKSDAGLLVGTLVGALTLGSAMPHLFAFFGGLDWRVVLLAASAFAVSGAVIINWVQPGPGLKRAARFNPQTILRAWRHKPTRLANFGYFGHMWELYAMWGWIGVFLIASFEASGLGDPYGAGKIGAFFAVAIGTVGAVYGGWIADRIGRTMLTMLAMTISGLCALLIGFTFGGPVWLMVLIIGIWGISVIADSAQFSTSVSELAQPDTIGTMLTVQTATGFALTLITVQGMPHWVSLVGWQWAFAPLAIGPFLGVYAMYRLRLRPEATQLANGKR